MPLTLQEVDEWHLLRCLYAEALVLRSVNAWGRPIMLITDTGNAFPRSLKDSGFRPPEKQQEEDWVNCKLVHTESD